MTAAGAFLNSFDGGPILIRVLGKDQQVLESYTVEVDHPTIASIRGSSLASPDLRPTSFAFARRPRIGADDVTFILPVPEREVYAMLVSGLSLMGCVARRRNKKRCLSVAPDA